MKTGVILKKNFVTSLDLLSLQSPKHPVYYVQSPSRDSHWSQSLNAPPYFDGSNYAFWKVRMRAFLCSIDETVWDAMDVGWTRLEAAKSTWDKTSLAAANANSKALNAIFCSVSPDEFHRISHIIIAKEAQQILETTYEGTRKSKTLNCRC